MGRLYGYLKVFVSGRKQGRLLHGCVTPLELSGVPHFVVSRKEELRMEGSGEDGERMSVTWPIHPLFS